jgi:hypothetical protein
MTCTFHTHGVIPAQAGIHLEIARQPQGGTVDPYGSLPYRDISGWTPAFAGVTPSLWTAICKMATQ